MKFNEKFKQIVNDKSFWHIAYFGAVGGLFGSQLDSVGWLESFLYTGFMIFVSLGLATLFTWIRKRKEY